MHIVRHCSFAFSQLQDSAGPSAGNHGNSAGFKTNASGALIRTLVPFVRNRNETEVRWNAFTSDGKETGPDALRNSTWSVLRYTLGPLCNEGPFRKCAQKKL